MKELELKVSFNISTLLLLTALVAFFFSVLRYTGFSDFYYLSLIPNELRRFGFALVLAISALGTMALIRNPRDIGLWVCARVLLLLIAVVSIRYCYSPDMVAESFYSALFLVMTCVSVSTTIVAASHVNFRLAWLIPLIVPSLVELYVSFVLLIAARKPDSFWTIYDLLNNYEPIIFTAGVAVALALAYLSFNAKWSLKGALATLVFMAIPICSRAYETWILGL